MTTGPDAKALRERCAREMAGHPRDYLGVRRDAAGFGWLREAFLAVRREDFVPDRVWWPHLEDGACPLIDRALAPRAWLKSVYLLRTPLITQLDDGATAATGPAVGAFTSSISSITVTVEALRVLAPQPGERVLEIGTGTGYSAALLARRTGPGTVTSIEISADLADAARRRLDRAGAGVRVIAGDGEAGHSEGGPYQRIIATASVRRIPPAWIAQLAPGGTLVVPLASPFGCDLTVRLTAVGDGRVTGRPVATVEYMRLRGQRVPEVGQSYGWPADTDPGQWARYTITADARGQTVALDDDRPTP
ncbi:methyltransferase domain-containing protein [Streptomyces sp. NPDC059070]|uniref:methyltransferase domain-containing protein n=1 Tax=Streptomyces sp. NPDC059070 TaxID=3346713 RepID=UPI0036C2AAA3